MKITPDVIDFKKEWEKPPGESTFDSTYGLRPGIKLIQWVLTRLGVPKLSAEERERLTSQTYPKIFGLYRFFVVVVWIISFVGLVLFMHFKFGEIQRYLFKKDAIFFSTFGDSVFTLFNLFGIILFTGFIVATLITFLAPKRFRDYDTAIDVVTGWVFEPKVLVRVFFAAILLYYLVFSPFIFFSLRQYRAFYPDRIVDNRFFSFSETAYQYSDIQKIVVESEYIEPRDQWEADVYLYFNVTFQSHKAVDFMGANYTPLHIHVPLLYKKLSEEGIPVEITPPTQREIDLVASKWCSTRQRNFYALFELQHEVIPNPSCFEK